MIDRRRLMGLMLALPLMTGRAGAQVPLSVLTTTGMIADAARAIGGGKVAAIMGPGLDPHGYRPTRSDILALSRADLVLWHGLNLEAQLASLLLDLASRKPVVAVAEALPKDLLLTHPEFPDRPDPHVWMAPALWAQVVARVADVLRDAAPDQATVIASNAATYQAEIAALHLYATETLASVPEGNRVLITAHDAFSYFGRAYGFEVLGIQGISTESEAGLARIGDLVKIIVSRKIGAVFVESSVSDRSMRALIEGAAAEGHTVTIGGELYSDAMGPDGSYEGTYVGMLDHNITTIARALGGQVPPRGMSGKLTVGL